MNATRQDRRARASLAAFIRQRLLVSFAVRLVAILPMLFILTRPASANIIQVTFTGEITFTFDATFGGPSFYGIEPGDLFSSVLTYDPAQPNLGTVQGEDNTALTTSLSRCRLQEFL
jgi:hypothetical protein